MYVCQNVSNMTEKLGTQRVKVKKKTNLTLTLTFGKHRYTIGSPQCSGNSVKEVNIQKMECML